VEGTACSFGCPISYGKAPIVVCTDGQWIVERACPSVSSAHD
jgi:hypothetical protein